MQTVCILPCTKSKYSEKMPARELFSKSNYFSLLREYAARKGYEKIFVASTKYGLIKLDDVIEPYDVALTAAQTTEWAKEIVEKLLQEVPDLEKVVLLTAEPQSKKIKRFLNRVAPGVAVEEPLRDAGRIGMRMQFLREQIGW